MAFDFSNLGFGNNPAVTGMAKAIGEQFNNQLSQTVLPGIGANAQLAGGFGGSRQGVAEGNAIQGMTQAFGNSLANLYGNAYAQDQNFYLGNKGQDLNYALGSQGQNQNFYTAQRGQDLQQQSLGANLFNQGVAGNLGIGQQTYNLGQQYMNAPAQTASTYGNIISPFSGLGSTTTANSSTNSSPWSGALGGAILGAKAQSGWNSVFG